MKTEASRQSIDYGTRRIEYILVRSDRKRLRIKVSPDLEVTVQAPLDVHIDRIRNAVRRKAPWIAKTIEKMQQYHPLPTPKRYISGETFIYLGRQYRLRVLQGKPEPAKLRGRFLFVRVPDKSRTDVVRATVERWYRNRAEQVLIRYLENCCELGRRHGIPEPRVTIRRMKTRWGSCTPKGHITLNVNLVRVPVHCIEYVIMHELCHLKHNDHGRAFYSLLSRCMPDWKKRKEAIDRIVL